MKRLESKDDAAFRPSDGHWHYALGFFKERVTKSQLRQALLGPEPIIKGELCDWKSRHVGAGIYEMWAEARYGK